MEIPALADLLDLQDVDLQIDRLLERRQGLPELEQYRQANAARVEAESVHRELADRTVSAKPSWTSTRARASSRSSRPS